MEIARGRLFANAARLTERLTNLGHLTELSHANNTVFVRVPDEDCQPLQKWLLERGIKAQITSQTRLVTHLNLSVEDIDTCVEAISDYFATDRPGQDAYTAVADAKSPAGGEAL